MSKNKRPLNLYLVRHGESEGNRTGRHQTADEPLSAKGIKQARSVAKRLADYPLDIIYTSPMARAKTTAEIISKKIGKDIEIWDSIHELLRPSDMRGKNPDDPSIRGLDELLREKFLDPNWKHSNEENYSDLSARADSVLQHLLKHHRKQNILCVSHGTFVKFLVSKAIFGDKLTPNIFVQMRYHLWAGNTGITHIEYTDKYGWALLAWNDTTHL